MRAAAAWLALVCVFPATATSSQLARRRTAAPPVEQAVSPSDCGAAVLGTTPCDEEAAANPAEAVAPLAASEVGAITAAAASAIDGRTMTVAVVDRAGRVLALFRQPGASPANDDLAVGVARTAAFFSHNQAPLSSRTVRFISGIHFPPGVTNTPNAALYGIENTNRGCEFNVVFNEGKCLPQPKSATNAGPCRAGDTSGCGPGIVTGKKDDFDSDAEAVLAGGIPLYRLTSDALKNIEQGVVTDAKAIGAIGVVGAGGDPQRDEYAALTGAFSIALTSGIVPVPKYPLPDPGNVFIDGLRLPFIGPDQRLRFDDNGLPIGVEALAGINKGTSAGTYVIEPRAGGCAANGWLAGPRDGSVLKQADVAAIVARAISASKRTRAAIRLPLSRYARMVIAVADTDGSILGLYRMPDATVFSVDVSVAKSRNVVWFSTNARDLPGVPNGTAVTNRTIGFGAQPLFPPGIDSHAFDVGAGPFFQLFVSDRKNACSQGSQPSNPNQNGIVFFPGASPLYRGGQLVGGLGVSGDGVEQDDYVTVLAAGDLVPEQSKWADRVSIDGVRLPMFKFPRHPEGVTECGGKPCD